MYLRSPAVAGVFKTERMSLRTELVKRLDQLKHRKMMIPRYIESNKAWAGKNHYTMDMILPIEKQIAETEAAIKGIDEWIKTNRENKKRKNVDVTTT